MTKLMITQKELKAFLHYCPETGAFTWLKDKGTYKCKGHKAGWVSSSRSLKYYRTMIYGVTYGLHRLAFLYMTGVLPTDKIDHKDGNGLNNKWDNLREADNTTNLQNAKKYLTNTSGVTGVVWDKESNKWKAQIETSLNGKRKNQSIGRFIDFNDAVIARKMTEYKLGFHANHGREM